MATATRTAATHASDCAIHNEPAYPKGPCDCITRIHPDLTAFRAVDACGGAFPPAEEESGYAQGYRDALTAASSAVKAPDARAEALLSALQTKRDYVWDVAEGHLKGKSDLRSMAREDLARIDSAIAKATAAA